MSSLGKIKQICIVLVLLALLVAFNARAAIVDGEDLVDPTAPLVINAAMLNDNVELDDLLGTFTRFEVSSILIRPNARVAVVNSQRVQVGEMVRGARVTAIEKESVTINIEGEIRILRLYENSIKTLNEGEG